MDDVIDKCRVCLSDVRDGIALFNGQNDEYLKELNRILETELTENIYWPKTLCSSCTGILDQVRRLKDTFRSTQESTVKICEESVEYAEYEEYSDDIEIIELVDDDQELLDQIIVLDEDGPAESPNRPPSPALQDALRVQREAAVQAMRELGVLKCYLCKKEFDEYLTMHNHMLQVHKCPSSFFVCCDKKLNLWKACDHLEFHRNKDVPKESNTIAGNLNRLPSPTREQTEEELQTKRDAAVEAMRELGVLNCHICKMEFNEYLIMHKHMLDAHDCKSSFFVCCNKKLNLWKACEHLEYHRAKNNSHDKRLTSKKPKCDQCGNEFASNDNLRVHKVRCAKGPRERKFQCPHCPRAVFTKGELTQHVRCVHENIYSAMCDICGKPFKTTAQLKSHQKTVHSEKPSEPCRLCGKYVFRIKLHERSCGAKKIPCDFCGKLVPETIIKRHIRSNHSNVKYTCEYCGKEFGTRGNWCDHVNNIHKGIRVSCLFCDHSSTSRKGNVQHMQKKHWKLFEKHRANMYEERFGKPRLRAKVDQNETG